MTDKIKDENTDADIETLILEDIVAVYDALGNYAGKQPAGRDLPDGLFYESTGSVK